MGGEGEETALVHTRDPDTCGGAGVVILKGRVKG